MHTRSISLVLFLIVALCVGSALPAWGQGAANTGTVAGAIADAQGAVVVGATVTLTDIGTNTARTTTTNAAGRYIFVDVPPGMYRATVAKQGFATTKAENQEVTVGSALTLNLTLQVGGASVVVEVQGTGNELQTMNATVGNTITSLTIDNLPSLGRDISSFVELEPGVGPDGSVAGAVLDQTYFSLDGGNNSSDMDGSGNVYFGSLAQDVTGGVATQNNLGAGVGGPTGVLPTPQDSVEEFKVNTAGQTADFNSSAGAEVKVVTKRGSNSWHGTAYQYYKDNNWSSQSYENDYFNKLAAQASLPEPAGLPTFHYSRFGGAIGGPLIPKEILGGKTFFFFNYEGFRFPNAETIDRNVPSPALRLGLVQDTSGDFFNINPTAVTYKGTPYPGNSCTGPNCTTLAFPTPYDPRGIGINPVVQGIWNTYEPPSNAGCIQPLCDGVNILGFTGNLRLPTHSNFEVARLDHDFSPKWHFMTSYRAFQLFTQTDSQVDIGGVFTGDTLGVPSSLSHVPQNALLWVAGLTTNITPNTTNDIHYSYLRNWWAYEREGDIPQPTTLGTLGGALEIFSGQSYGADNDLGPYNVNTQQTRTRYWDGKDQMIRDDVSMLKGNHLIQWGGTYQHNWDQHQRTDNGGGINYQPQYMLGNGPFASELVSDISICGKGSTVVFCPSITQAALGIVAISQIAYIRNGPTLALQPQGTKAVTTGTIPYYNVYFSDTWHLKPTLTLTYGLGYALEMPPTETSGKQDVLVDASNTPFSIKDYLASRERAALAGQVYNPEIGFALVGNVGNGLKYPYNPYYGEFSPRIALAWSPKATSGLLGNTVVRGGYGRQYGRLNGVDQILVPLLGIGPIQPVSCINNLSSGACPSGASVGTPATAFRIGPTAMGLDGFTAPLQTAANLAPSATLPQPIYPGINGTEGAASEALDPHFRPNAIDSFNLTIQRQLSRKVTLELGYIGRRIEDEFQPININAVPHMMTLGGQRFNQAYPNLVLQYCGGIAGLAGGLCAGNAGAVTAQPFFETALGGATSAYCKPFAAANPSDPCTAAVVANEGVTGTGNLSSASVWSLWSDLDGPMQKVNGGVLSGPTMLNTDGQMTSGVALNASIGHGNYNAGFASVKMADWRGLTMQSNLTWSKALGTGAVVQASSEYTADDPFNLNTMYGYQDFNRKIVYNTFLVYQPPFYKGQSGMMGRLLGGWTFSAIFAAGSGSPIEIGTQTGDGQEYGAGDNVNFFGNENAVQIAPITSGHAYYNNPSGGLPVNIFKQGLSAISDFRNPILGLDNKDGGDGNFIGLRYWNMDFSIKKNIRVAESVTLEFQGVFANIFNHNQWLDPIGLGIYDGSGPTSLFGALPGSGQEQLGGNRQIELGARVRF